jgi:hypothetical protein
MAYVSFEVIPGALVGIHEGLRHRRPIVNEVRKAELGLREAPGMLIGCCVSREVSTMGLVARTGVEPVIFALKGRRVNHYSTGPPGGTRSEPSVLEF